MNCDLIYRRDNLLGYSFLLSCLLFNMTQMSLEKGKFKIEITVQFYGITCGRWKQEAEQWLYEIQWNFWSFGDVFIENMLSSIGFSTILLYERGFACFYTTSLVLGRLSCVKSVFWNISIAKRHRPSIETAYQMTSSLKLQQLHYQIILGSCNKTSNLHICPVPLRREEIKLSIHPQNTFFPT